MKFIQLCISQLPQYLYIPLAFLAVNKTYRFTESGLHTLCYIMPLLQYFLCMYIMFVAYRTHCKLIIRWTSLELVFQNNFNDFLLFTQMLVGLSKCLEQRI